MKFNALDGSQFCLPYILHSDSDLWFLYIASSYMTSRNQNLKMKAAAAGSMPNATASESIHSDEVEIQQINIQPSIASKVPASSLISHQLPDCSNVLQNRVRIFLQLETSMSLLNSCTEF
jgi:hypothetical protein